MTFHDKIRNPDCELCALHEGAQYVCLMGSGKRKAKLMIVGEAPGAREDEAHRAFVGPAGKLLDELLTEVGISREECYITNAVKCRPEGNATPDRSHVRACGGYLEAEINKVQPRAILGLGNTALLALAGKSGITKHRGKVAAGSLPIYCTFHPAAALRSAHYLPSIRADFQAVARHLNNDRPKDLTKVRIIRTPKHLDALVRLLAGAKEIAFDLETTGLHEWEENAAIVTIGVSWAPGDAAVVPIWHEDFSQLNGWQAYVLRELKPVLEDTSKKFIAHNAKFDAKWLAKFGINVPVTFDTMIAAHPLDENRAKGLKPLAQMLLGVDDWDLEVKNAYNKPLKQLCIYNGHDCDYTMQLYHLFRQQLKEQPRVARLFKLLMMPASALFTDIEQRGIYVDPDRLQQRTGHAVMVIAKLEAYMMQFTEQTSINFNSPVQVGRWLFDELKLEVVERTEKGVPSTKESVLLKLQDSHKAIRALLKYRKWSKFLSTYLLAWAGRVDGHSRIHPNYRLTGTVTGRLSSSEPNLQQVPRDNFIRGILGAPREESTLVEADYSQVELRLAAMLSREKRMLELLNEGEDLHLNTARAITGKSDISKDERVIWGKHPNFGLLFSMKPEKYRDYCAQHGHYISSKEAEEVYAIFHKTYPALRKWHARVIRVAHTTSQAVTAFGRIRHLPDIKSTHAPAAREAERQAINSVVQGLASDICLFSAVRLSRQLNPQIARLVGSVHDSLLFEVHKEHTDLTVPYIKRTMEDVEPIKKSFGAVIDVPLKVDVEMGTHWSEGTSV